MKRLLTVVSMISLLVFATTGCRSGLIYNVQGAAVPASVSKSKKYEDVYNAIVRAGGTLGWTMKEEAPGHLIGTLVLRDHMAQVDIKFDINSYSITYRNSQNLKYDGTNIHSNYNGWIQRLQQNINMQLSMI